MRAHDLQPDLFAHLRRAGGGVQAGFQGVLTNAPVRGETAWLQVVGDHTCFYRDEELVA